MKFSVSAREFVEDSVTLNMCPELYGKTVTYKGTYDEGRGEYKFGPFRENPGSYRMFLNFTMKEPFVVGLQGKRKFKPISEQSRFTVEISSRRPKKGEIVYIKKADLECQARWM